MDHSPPNPEITPQQRLAALPWSVYLLECGDGSIYCGTARDVDARIKAHATLKGSRYVRTHGGVRRLIGSIACDSRSEACAFETRAKGLSRRQRLALFRATGPP